jgi:nicotinate phosphoribosyltransferase
MQTEAPATHSAAPSPALLTDLYELTMAYAYWRSGTADKEAVFHLSFRRHPFQGGFTIACGLASVVDYLQAFQFTETDLQYLASIPGQDRKPLFSAQFLGYLKDLRLVCDVDAIPEGTVVFPHEPLVRVQGPILQAQILETALLNFINFQSLIATKAGRICLAAEGDPVIEFGLRRAQGIDGALSASRSAYVGGCSATSNLAAGAHYGIPVLGTHAHSWVLSFGSELEAFSQYALALPNNCVFLVDTYDSIGGVRHAIDVGRQLREKGHELGGIRLDSGDLAFLSIEARKLLDAAGFPRALIIGSNDLDEHLIRSLKQQKAKINAWGVGTKLVTAHDHPALGGVYKLSAVRQASGSWLYKIKLSEQTAKLTDPGVLQVRRFASGGEFIGDAVYEATRPVPASVTIVDPVDPTRRKKIPAGADCEDLLVPISRGGKLVFQTPSLAQIRERVQRQLAAFHPGVKRFANPHQYPAGLELTLHDTKTLLILQTRDHVRSP